MVSLLRLGRFLTGWMMMKDLFVGWRTQRSAKRAVKEKSEFGRLSCSGDNGVPYIVYSVSGWGVSADVTRVVWLDEGLD